MSSLTVTPLSTALGAQISGVDITQPLNLAQRDAIEQAMHRATILGDVPF
jgi:taurine dioxygenase